MEVVFKTVGIIYIYYRLKVNSYVGSRGEYSLRYHPKLPTDDIDYDEY